MGAPGIDQSNVQGQSEGMGMTDLDVKRFKRTLYQRTYRERCRLLGLKQRLINTVKMQFELKWKP